MKTKQLIKMLERVPDAIVSIPYPDNGYGWWPVTGMTYSKETVNLYADVDETLVLDDGKTNEDNKNQSTCERYFNKQP